MKVHSSFRNTCTISIYSTALFLVASSAINVAVAEDIATNSGGGSIVKVSVYYETLCPYSRDFFVDQLYPVYQALKVYLSIDLVPYGNAKTLAPSDDSFAFECQHGAEECTGNMIHACAIAHVPDQDSLMTYLACTFDKSIGFSKKDNRLPEYVAENCASMNAINYSPIQKCLQGSQGVYLETMYGERTMNLNPKLNGVPAIWFNDSYNANDEDQAETDLLGIVCKYFSASKPPNCPAA